VKSTTVSKRFFVFFIFSLLAIAVLSNRLFMLRQFTGKPSQTITIQHPSDSTAPSGAQPRALLPPLASDAVPDLEESPRSGVVITGDRTATLRERSVFPTLKSRVTATAPTYILQSVLNL
jgi:hypothetical protein